MTLKRSLDSIALGGENKWDFTEKGPVMRNFDVFLVVKLKELLHKQLRWQDEHVMPL